MMINLNNSLYYISLNSVNKKTDDKVESNLQNRAKHACRGKPGLQDSKWWLDPYFFLMWALDSFWVLKSLK